MEDDCRSLNINLPNQIHELRDDLLKSLKDQRSSDLQGSSVIDDSLSYIKQQLLDVQSMLKDIPLQHRILRHLITDNMESRRNQIIDANPDTCRWILEDPANDPDSTGDSLTDNTFDVDSDVSLSSTGSSSNLQEDPDWRAELQRRRQTRNEVTSWLASGQGILHVSGNAGSGKSTLMKFIGQHERTTRELEAWAGAKQLLVNQFYFWAAGTESQQSMLGLYSSLLFQTLSQCPELIEKVFPNQLTRMRRFGVHADPTVEKLQGFDDAQVRDAFGLLLKQSHDADYRMCFLLDGLDEFKGNRLEHENLALILKSWTFDGNVKLLVSSRPWPEFENVFVEYTTMYLHQLNHFDIRTYCIERVKQDREINEISDSEDVLEIKEIVDSLAIHSQGIFLWAHLVLDNILQGIRQGDTVITLRAKVQEYPADLDSLYDKLREAVAKSLIDSNRADRMLLLAVNAPDNFYLPAMAFSWVLDDDDAGLLDHEFPTDNECRPYSEAEASQRLRRVIKQIHGLTRGLLELDQSRQYKDMMKNEPLNIYFTSPGIRFCHKSARDYLVLNESRYQKLCASWPGFHDTDVYGRIHLARLLYGASINELSREEEGSPLNRYLHWMHHPYCQSFDPKTVRKFESPLRPFLHGLLYLGPFLDSPEIASEPSFLQWCAWCGLDNFVLMETIEPRAAHIHSMGSSILLAVMYKVYKEHLFERMDVLLQLLDRRIGMDVMIEMWKSKEDTNASPLEIFTLPAWVVASWLLLDMMRFTTYLGGETKSQDLNYDFAVAALRCLHEYGEEIGERLSFTLGMAVRMAGSTDSVQPKRQFSAAEMVDWLEEECFAVRKAISTSSTAYQAQWSWCARTADGTQSPYDMMRYTPGKWLQENGDWDYRRQKQWWHLDICVLHWESVDVQLDVNERKLGFRVF